MIESVKTLYESMITAMTAVAREHNNPRSEVDAEAQLHIRWMQHLLNSAHFEDAEQKAIERA